MKTTNSLLLLLSFPLFSCATQYTQQSPKGGGAKPASVAQVSDPYIWLEDAKDPRVRPWALEHNAKVETELSGDPRAKDTAEQTRQILMAKDRIAMPGLANGKIRNFWQDAEHVRGIWRVTSIEEYAKDDPKWETILDVDKLNLAEKKSYVFRGSNCLPPDYDRCLVTLSDGGKDEAEVREFEVSTKTFVIGGFNLPPAKSDVSWIDHDHLFVGTNFGPDSLTTSGYPREVHIWTRGEPLKKAELVFEGKKTDVSVSAWGEKRPESKNLFVQRGLSFFASDTYLFDEKTHALTKLPFPQTVSFHGSFKGNLFASLRQDWLVGGKKFQAGSILSLPVEKVKDPVFAKYLETVFVPSGKTAFEEIGFTANFVEIGLLNNVYGEIHQFTHTGTTWSHKKLPFPGKGLLGLVSYDPFDQRDRVFASYQSFTKPTTLYYGEAGSLSQGVKAVKQMPARYDASKVIYEQFFATSRDGTRVPYFVVHQKSMKKNSANPTLMYGYGGFEDSMTPFYLGVIGKIWLEKGGVYVLTNIRGGSEFGPRWHEAALKENRQRAYDDFAAIAQDLFARKITSPRRLGIQGGSNGGLLVGAAVTQHPDYYHAVVCESALLDMLRYTKLPPGASWIGEYGDPDDPAMASVIEKYSPYQNVRAGVKYPKMFFHISTADDRVQPGHTRKMVARLEEFGNDVLMFENTEGGHGGAADLEQRVKKTTLEYIYLYQQLMDVALR
jgi:prolyl oligopeptidase